MNRFLKHIAFFSVPFIIGIIYLFVKPLDRAFAFNFLENDCYNHGSWIYNRIYVNKKTIDIAFIGTSATIQAIDEQKIESVLDSVYDKKLNLANLGYCRPGRNLHYVVLKDLLSQKDIKKLVLEVRDDEDRYSHPVFPNLAETKDVIAPAILFNRDIFDDCFKATGTRFEYLRKKVFRQLPEIGNSIKTDYGYGAGVRIAPEKELKAALLLRNKKNKALTKLQRDFYMQFPRTYLQKIADLCKARNIELVFLYIKAYGSSQKAPKELANFKKYGEVLIPPSEIFENPKNWMDPDHLNINGAGELAYWLAKSINSL